MVLHKELIEVLSRHLTWNKARLACFVGLLLALLLLKHTNLTQLALAFNGSATTESKYRRFQRFFQEVYFDYDAIARLIMEMFDFYRTEYYLTLDRTNWKWGKKNINILTLAVVYKGVAIPIYWLILTKQGNSNQKERIALLKRFIHQFGRHNILGILGDREFIGKLWWKWLTSESIPFLMRVKENQKVLNSKGQAMAIRKLFSDLKVGKSRILRVNRKVSDQSVWLSALRLESKELLIVAGNQRFSSPFEVYGFRWEIECLFQCLKGRGFHMEETRLTRYFRIKKVMALLAIGFCWAHKTGEWKQKAIKPLKFKTHGRLEKSIFRYGLDHLTEKLIHGFNGAEEALWSLIVFLYPPSLLIERDGKLGIIRSF
ncbi:MAG: IS4 family transposase [Methyloprofundus sp.]|nr:IS4 family transposase [Methyloprofundus sp.]